MPTRLPDLSRKSGNVGTGRRLPDLNAPTKNPPKKKGKGVGGFLGNLAGDVKDAAIGIPVGVAKVGEAAGRDAVDIVKHPASSGHFKNLSKIGKQVGEGYAETYGPLTRGEVGKFLTKIYEHPLGPALDVATVFTGGGAAVAKAGQVAAKAGVVSKASKAANLGRAESITLRSPRARYQGDGPTLKGKPLSRNPVVRGRQKLTDKALKKLPPTTPGVGEFSRYGRELERAPRQEALRLQHKAEKYNKIAFKLSPEEFAALHLTARGVHPDDYLAFLDKSEGASKTMRKVLTNPAVRHLVEKPTARLRQAHKEATALADAMTKTEVGRELVSAESATERVGLHRRLLEEAGITPRKLPLSPFYVPDVPGTVRVGGVDLAKGGVGIPRKLGSSKRNEGVLFRTGQLALTPDALGPEYLRTLRFGLFDDIHEGLVDSAIKLDKGQPLPQGYVFVRRSPKERIHAIEKTSGDRERALRDLIPDDDTEASELGRGFGTTSPEEAAEATTGHRMIVPESLAKQVAGEFTRQGKATRVLLTRPTQVWRSLVLGYRPAFLVNNVVGNHLLYALRNAGPAGLRAYLNAVRTAKGPAAVERLLRDPKTRNVITPRFIAEHFPEQMETFGATQGVMREIRSPRVRRLARGAQAGIIPATQAVAEGTLRRASVEAALRRSPEVRAVAKQMRGQTARLEQAAKVALYRHPELQRRISQEVDDTLGSYTGLTPFERNVVRSAIPFYAWYKAITIIVLKLAADHPARANLLATIGRIGQESGLEATLGVDMPSYLEGAIPLGAPQDGTVPVLTTGGLNPIATIPQVLDSLGAAVKGNPGEAASAWSGQLNPFIAALIESATGRSLYNPAIPVDRRLPGVSGALEGVFMQLPETRVATAGPTKLYPRRSRFSEALAAAGIPIKHPSIAEAQRRAKRERER